MHRTQPSSCLPGPHSLELGWTLHLGEGRSVKGRLDPMRRIGWIGSVVPAENGLSRREQAGHTLEHVLDSLERRFPGCRWFVDAPPAQPGDAPAIN